MAYEIDDPREVGTQGLKGLKSVDKQATDGYEVNIDKGLLDFLGKTDVDTYSQLAKKSQDEMSDYTPVGNQLPNFSRYDADLSRIDQLQNINDFRADQQSNLLKATNAVISGVLSGLATAVEDFSYILDFEEWGKVFSGQDTLERNWLGQAMVDAKEALYGAMPIYERERKDTFSDNFFRWSTLRSGLDSMVGFAVPGGAISKGLSLGTKALRASRAAAYLSKLAETNKIAKGLDKGLNFLTTGPSGEVVNSLVSGMLTNDAEGKMMAFEVADNARMQYVSDNAAKLLEANKDTPNYTVEQALAEAKELMDNDVDFNNKLAEEQTEFVNRNRIFMLSDAFGIHGVFKGIGKTRNLLKDKGIAQAIKDLKTLSSDNFLLQMTKEGAEEIGQNILQSEAEYQVNKSRGALSPKDAELSLTERILNFGTSTQALVEGAMGFITGGIQRNVMRATGDLISGDPLGKKRKEEYAKAQAEQKKILDSYTEAHLSDLVTAEINRTEAAADINAETLTADIKERVFNSLATEAFQNGTTEQLERLIQDTANLSPEQAAERGYDPDYKQQAEQRIKDLQEAEKMYLSYSAYPNASQLLHNRLMNRSAMKFVENIKEDLSRHQKALNDKVNAAYPQIAEMMQLMDEESGKSNLLTNVSEEYIDKARETLESLDEYKAVQHTKSQLELAANYIKDSDKKFKEYLSPEYQKDYLQAQKSLIESIRKEASKEVKQTKDAVKEEISSTVATASSPEEKQTIVNQAKEDAGNDEIAQQAIEEVEQETANKEALATSKTLDEEAPIDNDLVDKLLQEITGIDYFDRSPKNVENRRFFKMTKAEVRQQGDTNLHPEFEDSGYFSIGAIKRAIQDIQKRPSNKSNTIRIDTLNKLINRLNDIFKQQNKPLETDKVVTASSSDSNIFSEEGITIETADTEREVNDIINTSDPKEFKSPNGAGLVAYLSREWLVKNGSRVSASNSAILNDATKLILDPNRLRGDELIHFVINDSPNIPVYYNGTKSTWGAVKDEIENSNLSPEDKTKRIASLVPIAIETVQGPLGFVHDINWINSKNVVEENIAADRDNLMSLREAIYNGTITTSRITNISNGHLIRTVNNQYISTLEAFPDDKLKFAIYKNGDFTTKVDKLLNKPENLKEGYTYALLPARDGSTMAIPLKRNLLTSKQVSSISQAIRIFIKAKKGEKLNTGEQQVVDKIKEIIKLKNSAGNNVNFDIRTTDGIKNYVSIFTYVHKADKMNLVNTIVSNPSDYRAISIEENANSLVLSLARGAGINIATAKLDHQTGNFLKEQEFLDNLEDHLQGCYFYGNSTLINKDKVDIPIIGENNLVAIESSSYTTYVKRHTSSNVLSWNLGTEENPNYVYFNQPSVSFDTQTAKAKAQAARSNVPVKKEIIENTPVSKQEGDIDLDALETNLNDDDLVYNAEAFLDEEAYKDFGTTQEGITLITSNVKIIKVPMQRQVINMISEKIARALIGSDEATLSPEKIKSILSANKNWFERQLQLAKQANKTKVVEHLQEYLDHWSNLERLVKNTLAKRSGFKVSEVQNSEIDSLAEFGEDNSEHERNYFSDTYSLELDSKDTVSAKMKLFLSFIPNGKTNYLTQESQFEPFDIVYNSLSAMLAGTKPSYTAMINKLTEINQDGKVFPWLTNLLAKLENAPDQIKREFVTAMNKHYVSMKFAMWRKVNKDNYAMEVWDANANSIQQTITNSWYNNLINSDLTTTREGEYVYDPEVTRQITLQYDEWVKKKHYPTQSELDTWLKRLGIVLSPKSLETLTDGEFTYGGRKYTYPQLFQGNNSLFGTLVSKLQPDGGIGELGNVLFSDSIAKALINLEARNTAHIFSNSHRSGSKTVYSYTNDKYIIDRYTNLMSDPILLTRLSKLSFNSKASWLQQLLKTNDLGEYVYNEDGLAEINTESLFFKNFAYDYLALDSIKELGTKTYRETRNLNTLSPAEHEIVKMTMFTNNGSVTKDGTRIGKMFYPTMSDKTTMILLTVPLVNISLNEDGEVSSDTVDFIYDNLVQAEIDRILKWQTITNNGESPINVASYNDGAKLFMLFPQLNEIEELYTYIGDKRVLKDINSSPELINIIKDTLQSLLDNKVDQQVAVWNKLGVGLSDDSFNFIDNKYLGYIRKQIASKDKSYIQRFAAADFAINYIISNANVSQLFTGDPALYYKKEKSTKPTDYVGIVRDTYINIGKRLAGDIAPGQEADWSGISETYKLAVINDAELASLSNEYYKSIGFNSKTYGSITGTDAQELTTLKEHLDVMYAFGKLPESQYKNLLDKYSKKEEFTTDELDVILQPIKPVYVHNRTLAENDVDVRTYVKSSSFPLIPQLTKGLQIDALREAMESQGVDRAAYISAVKVGAPLNRPTIWDNKGDIIPKSLENLQPILLNREGFKIQQEVPYHEDKDRINGGTQERKLLFSNLRNVKGFKYHGKEMSGEELEKEYINLYKSIWDRQLDDLLNSLEYNKETNTINPYRLAKILQEEAIQRNYPINDKIGLTVDDNGNFKFPLWALPSANKYEALLLSIVDNRVRKIKIPGMSYVLGSEEGFKIKSEEEVNISDRVKNDIVFTSSWTGKLLPQGLNSDGTIRNTQVLAPCKFRDNRGNLIDIRKYAKRGDDGFLRLDENKLPKEYLKLFGFRIPTQGHGSMAGIEIVGFLPENVGDLIIASRDFTIQMGSDFDVDKLYTYQYQLALIDGKFKRLDTLSEQEVENIVAKRYSGTKDGAVDELLSAIFGEDISELEALDKEEFRNRLLNSRDKAKDFNNLLDIHLSVMSNPSPEVQSKIASPVSFGKLKGEEGNLAKEIDTYRNNRLLSEEEFNGLTADYQRTKYINAIAGKAGVATFSSAAMFIANAQGKGLNYVEKVNGDNIFKFAMGNLITTGDLSRSATLSGKRLVSKVMEAFQSAAVDNEKEQILSKLNINAQTFPCIKAMVTLGFEEDSVAAIIAQDIVFDYVDALVAAQSSLSDYNPNLEIEVYNKLVDKYTQDLGLSPEELSKSIAKLYDLPTDKLIDYIKDGAKLPDYGLVQVAVLDNFLKLSNVGRTINNLSNLVNTESAGLGTSIIGTMSKERKIMGINDIAYADTGIGIENGYKLIGEFNPEYKDGSNSPIIPETIQGIAIVNALFTANKLFSGIKGKPLFPYNSLSFRNANDILLEIMNRNNLSASAEAELGQQFFDGMKSYIFTKPELFGIMNSSEMRKQLFLDSNTNISTASYVSALQKTPYGKTNPFLGRLAANVQKNGTPSLIKYNAASGVNLDESDIYQGFVEMLLDNRDIETEINGKIHNINTRQLAIDLIYYSYLSGGIQQAIEFVKYIPVDLLEKLGFSKKLLDLDFNNTETLDVYTLETDATGFIQQWMQHNPGRAPIKLIGDAGIETAKDNDIEVLTTGTLESNKGPRTIIESFKPKTIDIANPSRLVKGVDFGGEILFHPYVSAYVGGGRFVLYKYTGSTYNRIPTLGTFGMSEYQSDITPNTTAESILESNNTESNLAINTKEANDTNTIPVIPAIPNEQVRNYIAKYHLDSNSSVEVLREIYRNAENPTIQTITKSLGKTATTLNVDPKFEFTKSISTTGRYNVNTNSILIRVNPPEGWSLDRHIQETMIHEMTHVLLNQVVSDYSKGNFDKLTVNQRRSIELLDSVRTMLKARVKQENISNNEVTKAVENLQEFVASSLSSRAFREFVSEQTNARGQSIWNRIVELLTKLCTELGIFDNINQTEITALMDTVILNLIESQVPNKVPAVKTTTKSSRKVDAMSNEYKDLIANLDLAKEAGNTVTLFSATQDFNVSKEELAQASERTKQC